MNRFSLDHVEIEYEVRGEGEPVLLIHPSLLADGLACPLLAQPELAARYRLIHYHRRGYVGSSLGSEPLTYARQAADAAILLNHLEVNTAHIVGYSSGGSMALQLAVDAPDLVHSLVLLEPALNMISSGKADLEHLILPVMSAYRAGDKQKTVESFCEGVFGPNWQPIVEHAVPGSIEQAIKDLDTFMKELSAIQDWQFGPMEAAEINQPVLSVLGVRSSPFMVKGRELLHTWFPQAEDLDVDSTHLLHLYDPKRVAHGMAEFFARHPIS